MTLVVITSQLAGCATMSSDKTLKSMQESPDVSAEHATPGADDLQYMADSDSDAGLIEDQNNQKLEEISHDELIVVFEQQYEISKEINNSDSKETIQNELLMIEVTTASMSKSLPSDYETQYREWRPSVISQATEDTLTKPVSQPSSQSSGKPSGGSSGGQQTQGGTIIIDDTEGLNIVNGSDFNKTIITDPNELDTGIDDPYASYGKVTIGYGGSGG